MLADRYGDLNKRMGYMKKPKGYSPALWKQYADLGLLGVPFAEEHGGLGQGLDRDHDHRRGVRPGLAIEPYFATVVLGGGALRHSGNAGLLGGAGAGHRRGQADPGAGAPGTAGPLRPCRYRDHRALPTARAAIRWKARRTSSCTATRADKLIVAARASGGRTDRSGIGLFLVDAKANGVTRRGYPTQDGMRAADVTLSAVRVGPEAVLAGPDKGLGVLERVVDEAIAALSAEAVGAMAALHELTVEYLKTRKQFGVPIGSFQVLQHRAVDMLTALEQARSMAYYATMMAAETDARERRKAMSAAKVQIGRSARLRRPGRRSSCTAASA